MMMRFGHFYRRNFRILFGLSILFVCSAIAIIISVNKLHDNRKLYCDFDLLADWKIEKRESFFSTWESFCVENYDIMHAISPGEFAYYLIASKKPTLARHVQIMPEGRVLLRSSDPIDVTFTGGKPHVTVKRVSVIWFAKDYSSDVVITIKEK